MLRDAVELVNLIKQVAVNAVGAGKPVEIVFGKVIGVLPLKIQIEQKMTLSEAQLVLCRNVTEYTVEMTVDHYTENETEHTHDVQDTYTGGGASGPTQHLHAYKGRKKFTVHNGLAVGEEVVLFRQQGGQRFVVLDRVGGSG